MSSAAEKVFDTLPRNLKRLSEYNAKLFKAALTQTYIAWFEGLMAGSDADIDAVRKLLCCISTTC